MGIIYKLKPEINNWIVEKKRANPPLSCRTMISLVRAEFKIKVSKSSVNSLFKEAGLSMPIGRRRKKIRPKPPFSAPIPQIECKGKLLKALTGPKAKNLLPEPPPEPEAPKEIPLPPPPPETTGKTPEKTPEKIPEKAPEKTPEKVPEKAPEIVPEKAPEKIPEKTPVKTPEMVSEKTPEKTPEKVPEKAPEIVPEKAPEKVPEKIPEPTTPKETPPPQPKTPMEVAGGVSPKDTLQKALSSGAILLKAVDYLIGGSYHICEIIKQHLNIEDEHLLAKIESLIYAPFLKPLGAPLDSYLNELKAAEVLVPDILRALSKSFTAVRCIKVLLSNGQPLYLDGQMHTVWSVPHIPYDFNSIAHNIKSNIRKTFSEEKPLILFMAPGYERPTEEFYKLISSLGYGKSQITGASLYDNNLRQLEFIKVEQYKKHFLVFGLWPWQFSEYRQVKKIGDFKPFYFQEQGKNFYLADIVLELTEFDKKSKLLLPGCALKNHPSEKTLLLIVTNLPEDSAQPEYLASLYLNHWPNLKEAFQDYSRKVELFTYTASSRQLFSPEAANLEPQIYDMEHLFDYYLKVLDLYFKWHFLPPGYLDKDFSTLEDEFYRVKVNLKPQENYSLATFQLPPESSSAKALGYACRRLNEREIALDGQRRLWLSL